MSIFKDTFKDYVKNQITTRQDLLSKEGERPIEFQKYVSAKSPWARMVSFVDYNNSIDLAKNYVLYGGTLYQVPNTAGPGGTNDPNKTRLRYGIGQAGSAYGSELGYREYGLRPMPGIESISSRTISAYGSLRETTVKYYAWDLKQLQDLNILFMKPGYPVLIEWGWSLYLNNRKNNSDPFNINNKFITIDPFEKGIDQKRVYELIKKYTELHHGNYDGNLGFIKNYSYTLLRNGGFECTTTIISMGDVINSLKFNGGISEEAKTPTTGSAVPSESNDEFCNLLTEISNGKVSSYVTYDDFRSSYPVSLENENKSVTPYSDLTKVVKLKNPGDVKQLPGGDERYTKYISFGYFIHILNYYASLYESKNKKIYDENFVSVEIPHPSINSNIGNGYCVSSRNAMSINNDVCFIGNFYNNILKDKSGKATGFFPAVKYIEPTNANKIPPFYKPYPINLGIIGNIYVNIGFLIATYKSISIDSKGTVATGPYIRKILKEIEYTLGSINDFDIVSIDNVGIIVDKHYVEPINNTNKESKFELNIMGLKNTVREHQVISKIFEEQSTMIAIAAQDRANIASIQTSTNVELNKNIYNRLYKNLSNRKTEDDTNIIYKNTQTLLSFVSNYIITGKRPIYSDTTLSALNSYLNTFLIVKDGGTNYKGIVPISLNVKLDGISGITIGEIFRINADILPTEYKDKSVGFIVTGIDHSIDRNDWVTNLKTQFCLLDQGVKYIASEKISNDFIEKFGEYAKQEAKKTRLQIHYYNLLFAFLHDFFDDQFLIKNYSQGVAVIDYKDPTPSKNKKLKSYADSYLSPSEYTAFMENIAAYTILGEKTKMFIRNENLFINVSPEKLNNPINLLDYLIVTVKRLKVLDEKSATIYDIENPTAEQLNKLKGTVEYIEKGLDEYRVNIKKYLNYVIYNSTAYQEVANNSVLTPLFSTLYNSMISLMETNNTKLSEDIVNAFKSSVTGVYIDDAVVQLYNAVIDPYTDYFKNNIKPYQFVVQYINPESYDAYGKLVSSNIVLEEVIEIFVKLEL